MDKSNPLFGEDDTHLSTDTTPSYLCVGHGSERKVFGVGDTPREALALTVKAGLDRQNDDWAIWEKLVPGGRIRLVGQSGITVVLPSDIPEDEREFWTNRRNAQRLRMIACSRKFASRIIRVRSDRLERLMQQMHQQEQEAAVNAVENILKGEM